MIPPTLGPVGIRGTDMASSPLISGFPSWMKGAYGWGTYLLALAVLALFLDSISGFDERISWLLALAVLIGTWLLATGKRP
jgi:hypothetical protein